MITSSSTKETCYEILTGEQLFFSSHHNHKKKKKRKEGRKEGRKGGASLQLQFSGFDHRLKTIGLWITSKNKLF
jgi:hypothetical protein